MTKINGTTGGSNQTYSTWLECYSVLSGNNANITIKLYAMSTGGTYNWNGSSSNPATRGDIGIKDGTKDVRTPNFTQAMNNSINFGVGQGTPKLLKEISLSVPYKSDGTLSLKVRAQWDTNGHSTFLTGGTISETTWNLPVNITKCTAPTAFWISNPFDGSINLSFSGAKNGVNNIILSTNGYEYQHSLYINGVWGSWSGSSLCSSSPKSQSITVNDGQLLKFRIRTRGSAGASWYSDWVESNNARKNSAPTAPTSIIFTKSEFNLGENIQINWSGATDANNNIKHYLIQFRQKTNDIWGLWNNLKTIITSSGSGVTTESPTNTTMYRIQTVDTFDRTSDWKESGVLTLIDSSTVKVGVNNNFVDGELYLVQNNQWVKFTGDIFVGVDNQWVKSKK